MGDELVKHPCRGATNASTEGGIFALGGLSLIFCSFLCGTWAKRGAEGFFWTLWPRQPLLDLHYPRSSGGGVRVPDDPLPKLRELTFGVAYRWFGLQQQQQPAR